MSATAETILGQLKVVNDERARRKLAPGLEAKVARLKEYQQRRFSCTYADLLASTRYAAVARFFLDELYGPSDFTHRDEQFGRVVPTLVRLFPREIVETVATLAELHALSESLDTEMASHLADVPVSAGDYIQAWQRTGRALDRQQQITLTLAVADRLDGLTRKPLLRNSLRLMRSPARVAGLGELQSFLETGFDTFRAMSGTKEFVALVGSRERAVATALFAATVTSAAGVSNDQSLASLP